MQPGTTVSSKNLAKLHYELARALAYQRKRKDALNHLGQAVKADPAFKAQAKKDAAFALWRRQPDFQKTVR